MDRVDVVSSCGITTRIGMRVVGVLVSKLDSESETLNLRLRGGMCEVTLGV